MARKIILVVCRGCFQDTHIYGRNLSTNVSDELLREGSFLRKYRKRRKYLIFCVEQMFSNFIRSCFSLHLKCALHKFQRCFKVLDFRLRVMDL